MSILKRIFKIKSRDKKPRDIMEIVKKIGPQIDNVANDIFTTYSAELISEPVTFIIPAVWGARKDSELTELQKEMNKKIAPAVNGIVVSFDIKNMTEPQKFALGYLVRGLLISKITYMIEAVKNIYIKNNLQIEVEKDILCDIKPIGNA